MKRMKVTLTSETDPEAKLELSSDDYGNIQITANKPVVILAPEKTKVNRDVRESLETIMYVIEEDVPIGATITRDGQRYTCKKTPKGFDEWDACDICAFRHKRSLCSSIRCSDSERADNTNIIFE